MNKMINYVYAALLTLPSYRAVAADAESFRHEIEVFFSSGVGSVVSIILLLLFLLWLLLPLAVFGLKSRLKQLTAESRETNRVLAEIRETNRVLADKPVSDALLAHIDETNKILADIREELSVLNEDEAPVVEAELTRSKTTVYEDDSAELYDQIKYDP
ncbi:MAG: hypothetical protein JSW45_00240 [Thiotrichales bacterium]|nr:MAG: hypothetical protein JSW45_00240 [Thiotrichales bacterium]